MLVLYSVQTTNLTVVGKKIHSINLWNNASSNNHKLCSTQHFPSLSIRVHPPLCRCCEHPPWDVDVDNNGVLSDHCKDDMGHQFICMGANGLGQQKSKVQWL